MSNHITSADHTTHYFDSERLNAAQLDGRACVICGAEGRPMKPVSTVPGRGQVFACTGETPEPELTIPAKIRAEAEQAARDAAEHHLSTWREEMRAHERQTRAIVAGEKLPAPAWLEDDPCPEWCVAEPHRASDHPDDRTHYAGGTWVPLVTEEPVVMHPLAWAPPEIEVGMEQRYREKEPRVHLSDQEGRHVWHLTLDEAEKVAHAMLAHVQSVRGGWRPAVLPFDQHGQCGDPACVACRPEVTSEASA